MPKLRIVDREPPWMVPNPGAVLDGSTTAGVFQPVADTHDRWALLRFHHAEGDQLQLFEVRVRPGASSERHAHLNDEIIYVLEGDLAFGSRHIGPGGSVFIPGRTLYRFTAGAEGARFLNFRARQDLSYLTASDLVAPPCSSGRHAV